MLYVYHLLAAIDQNTWSKDVREDLLYRCIPTTSLLADVSIVLLYAAALLLHVGT